MARQESPPHSQRDALNGGLQPAPELFCQALGQAVVKIWSHMPPELQHELFEGAMGAHGESFRQQLAVFLHGEHPRTSASIKARAMIEPDSLGG